MPTLVSICHTPDCVNNNVPIAVMTWVDEETGETVHADQIQCGGCGQVVDDIREIPARPEEG